MTLSPTRCLLPLTLAAFAACGAPGDHAGERAEPRPSDGGEVPALTVLEVEGSTATAN